ncbi:hypothetical protein ACFLUC_01725 [Chloroflexota bacterium]
MSQNNHSRHNINLYPLRLVLAITLGLNAIFLYYLTKPVYESGRLFESPKWQIAVAIGAAGILMELGVLFITWTKLQQKLVQTFESLITLLARLGKLNLILMLLGIVLFSYLSNGPLILYTSQPTIRLFPFWLVVLACSILLRAWDSNKDKKSPRNWLELLGASLLFTAVGYLAGTFLPSISKFPFTVGWSETSRFYYASLFFSERIYGIDVAPTVLHPSRYLMQATPFLQLNSPLWLHRAWQVFLWLVITAISAYTLVHRLSISDNLRRWMMYCWVFLFILIGPVFYHLQIPFILILLTFNNRSVQNSKLRLAITLGGVLAASIWAGISRLNWFPVPGMLAATLFLLEIPLEKASSENSDPEGAIQNPNPRVVTYILKPIILVLLGTGVSFISQALYILWSGNPVGEFTSSFSSELLWYRLLPNPTYPPGIVPAVLLVSLPLIILVVINLNQNRKGNPKWRSYYPYRHLALMGLLFVLFIGGLVVSVKIGGGSNLHNLDAYLYLLLVTTTYILFDKYVPDRKVLIGWKRIPNPSEGDDTQFLDIQQSHKPLRARSLRIHNIMLILALLVPIYSAFMSSGNPRPIVTQEQISKDLVTISDYAQSSTERGEEVLFITNRHLLTFEYVKGVPLVPEYEKVFLMEMAMAGDPLYLERFNKDLKTKRFKLIISDPLFRKIKDRTDVFGEENNAWVREVARKINCYYRIERRLDFVNIHLLVPRSGSDKCP